MFISGCTEALDVSMSSDVDLNMSIDVDPEEALKIELAETKAEFAAYKKKVDPLLNLFTRRNVKGNVFSYGSTIKKMSLGLLAEGESPASCERFFEAMATAHPVMVDCSEETKSVPTERWFRSLRSSIPDLNRAHLEEIVRNVEELTVCVDASPAMNQTNVIGLGIVDQVGSYTSIGLSKTKAKTGKAICDDMDRVIDATGIGPEIRTKTVGLMSDRAAAQVLANKLWIKKNQTEHHQIKVLPCYMYMIGAGY